MIAPRAIVEEARSWVDVPFRHLGRDRHGIDCIGLPIVVGLHFALLPSGFATGAYSRLPTGELVQRMRDVCTPLPRATPACIVMIAWTKVAAHVSICTGDTLVHAYESVGSVVEHGYRGRWVRMSHSFWALPGVAYE